MNRPLIVIFAAIGLDAVGIGLIFPILPRLIETVTDTQNPAPIIGIMLAFVFGGQKSAVPFWCLGALHEIAGKSAQSCTKSASLRAMSSGPPVVCAAHCAASHTGQSRSMVSFA